jgi:lysophospholipase L1-like esterase
VDLRWSDFNPPAEPANIQVLHFGLTVQSPRPASYVIDRPQFVPRFAELGAEAELAAQAQATPPQPDPELAAPAALVARGETLVKARQLLANKKPLTILAWGDSVTGGAQLWTVGDDAAQAEAVYHGQLRQRLARQFGYDDIRILKVSHGGYQVRQAVDNLQAEVLDQKPDLVILAFGAGDTLYSDFETYQRLYPGLIERIRAAGIEVILFVPTPIEFHVAEGEPFARFVREYAAEHHLAIADVRAGLMSQGEAFLARWICDGPHPNQRAHEYMGAILAELFK